MLQVCVKFASISSLLIVMLMNLKKVVVTMMVGWMAISVHAQWENSLKVVVSDNGLLVGRYVRQTDSTYIANPVDWEEEVPKKGFRVEVWTPEKGKGFVGRKDGVTGNINVRKGPSTKTAIVAKITQEDSDKDYPDNVFDCLGKTKGWYKIKIKGKVGYVRQDLVSWAAYFAD